MTRDEDPVAAGRAQAAPAVPGELRNPLSKLSTAPFAFLAPCSQSIPRHLSTHFAMSTLSYLIKNELAPPHLSPSLHLQRQHTHMLCDTSPGPHSQPQTARSLYTYLPRLASPKGVLFKTANWSKVELLQALADLNSETLQLSASVEL
ncbi:hypothetical protein BD309DRAFT_1023093 [Dichomitus squalens]|uniref:Uncharacterized protein n=1 Tax=Dichomitus squalens TaxID=114155 RepID=A0A4Q9PJ91_9APHY|nr:hypothetical protein BD309DRAFT_1023093 [Dichomitus squalens]TBU54151.1 hypothetical protein BD310DRAFT_980590 [Dichomitus squalens]